MQYSGKDIPEQGCNESEVRLVDGRTEKDGQVELCLNGFWDSVCDDNWDERDTRVVCRQLGYNGCKRELLLPGMIMCNIYSFAASLPLESRRIPSSSFILYFLDEVNCSGSEMYLTECGNNGFGIHDCFITYNKAGVICSDILY